MNCHSHPSITKILTVISHLHFEDTMSVTVISAEQFLLTFWGWRQRLLLQKHASEQEDEELPVVKKSEEEITSACGIYSQGWQVNLHLVSFSFWHVHIWDVVGKWCREETCLSIRTVHVILVCSPTIQLYHQNYTHQLLKLVFLPIKASSLDNTLIKISIHSIVFDIQESFFCNWTFVVAAASQ